MSSPKTFQTQNIEWQARLQGVPLAPFRARALAFLVDTAIVVLLLTLPSAWAKVQGPHTGKLTLSFEFGGLVSVVIAVLYFGLGTFLGKGRTVGKYLFGIRVVSLVHSHMSLWHSLERTLGYAASSLEAGFGFFQFFTHPNRQTVHDRIAETIVIVSAKQGPARAAHPKAPLPAGRHGTMKVIDNEPQDWFLIQDGDTLLFDVNCSHGAVGYAWTMALDADEAARYASVGRAFLTQLADDVQRTAPGVLGSTSPFVGRNLHDARGQDVNDAITRWRQAVESGHPRSSHT